MSDNPQLVFGHFRVAAHPDGTPVELGRGAMGVTYKAFDERLRIDVALKLITPAQIDNPKAQSSFLREARAAARIHHSNVASVVFLNDTPGNFFYAMEFVEGQPLRDWMQAHPTPPSLTIIGVALQIAHGLEAIHEQHLVHRDLKPTNVMMVRTSRTGAGARAESDPNIWKAKIIDFGLARAVSPGPGAATQTAGFHGTALYASPEQCEERIDLDGRSDLYSLGCIMWEMLCGAPPFHARTHRELLNQHVSEPVPMDRLAHAPPSLAAVVAQLLAKEPDHRFPDALALIKALERCREKLESGEEVAEDQAPTTIDPARFFSPEKARPTSSSRDGDPQSTASGSRRDLWIVGVAVLALIVPILIFFVWPPAHPPAPVAVAAARPAVSVTPMVAPPAAKSPRKSIAVLPFKNLSSEKENEYFADGVQEDVLTNLTKIRDLRVVSRTSVQRYREQKDRKLPEIARDLGVGVVLQGSVRRSGDKVLISAQLIDAETDEHIWAETYDRKFTDIFALQSEIAIAIATALKANLAPAERSEVTRQVVAKAGALEPYFRARGLMSDFSDGRNLALAIEALQEAVTVDPTFARAQAHLSMLHSLAYDWGDRTPEHRDMARLSAEQAIALAPDLPEALLAMAIYYYRIARDFEHALPFFQRSLAAMPGNVSALYGLAAMDRRQGKWDEAAAKFEQVLKAIPGDPVASLESGPNGDPLVIYNAANTYIFMRKYEDAWRILEERLRLKPDQPALTKLKGELFLTWKGDLGPMREELATRPPTVPDPENYIFDKVQLLLYERKFDEALAVLRGSTFSVLDGQTQFLTRDSLEAEILTQAGRTAEAQVVWKRAAGELAKNLAAAPTEPRLRMAYALALAGEGGHPEESILEARRAANQIPIERDAMDGTAFQAGLALVLLRSGDPAGAAKIVDHLRKIPSIIYDSEFNLLPAWDGLPGKSSPSPSKP